MEEFLKIKTFLGSPLTIYEEGLLIAQDGSKEGYTIGNPSVQHRPPIERITDPKTILRLLVTTSTLEVSPLLHVKMYNWIDDNLQEIRYDKFVKDFSSMARTYNKRHQLWKSIGIIIFCYPVLFILKSMTYTIDLAHRSFDFAKTLWKDKTIM